MQSNHSSLIEKAQMWAQEDPDSKTQTEIDQLIKQKQFSELEDRFRAFLQFGTAGLRGLLGAGPNRMNRLVVAKATAGVCQWIKSKSPKKKTFTLCVGFDGRHRSQDFAEEVVRIAAGFGIRTYLFDHPVPTPVLAYSVLQKKADAGVTITASHNPPDYNGYKLFSDNGAQIITPDDQIIAEAIRAVGTYNQIPKLSFADAKQQGWVKSLGVEFKKQYLNDVKQVLQDPKFPAPIKIAYTPLHGVGKAYAEEAFQMLEGVELSTVETQARPDPDFPTVAFPNPEEEGVMDLVIEHAKKIDADLILANDPDADRLAVATKNAEGTWVQLNGNEIGALLANYILQSRKETGPACMLSTLVSSPLLSEIAKQNEIHYEPTLTGFKWIANTAIALKQKKGFEFLFGYEEALGYCVGPWVKDKDGISAALLMAELASVCKAKGVSLLHELESIWQTYGLFKSRLLSFRFPDIGGFALIQSTMQRLRENPPLLIGDISVKSFSDLQSNTKKNPPQNEGDIYASLPTSDLLVFTLEGDHRVIVRPSGTEPKVKSYLDVKVDISESGSLEKAHEKADGLLDQLESSIRLLIKK